MGIGGWQGEARTAAGTPGSLGEMQNLQPHPGQSGLPPGSAGGPVSHSSMALSVNFTNFFIDVGCKEGKLYQPHPAPASAE